MGYALLRFLAPIDKKFVCLICCGVFRIPCPSSCGHLYCHDCLKDGSCKGAKCLVDGCRCLLSAPMVSTVQNAIYLLALWDQLAELKIRCNYAHLGCQETPTLDNLDDHLRICSYQICENCNICGCDLNAEVEEEHDCVRTLLTLVSSHEIRISGLRAQVKLKNRRTNSREKSLLSQISALHSYIQMRLDSKDLSLMNLNKNLKVNANDENQNPVENATTKKKNDKTRVLSCRTQ